MIIQQTKISADQRQSFISYLFEAYKYRELLLFLCWTGIIVKYKQTILGALWSIIGPLGAVVTLTIVFGKLAKLPSEGNAPYALLVFSGLIPWQLFSSIIGNCTRSLVINQSLVRTIYFPKIILPIQATIMSIFNLLASILMIIVLIIYLQYSVDWAILLFPVFLTMGIFLGLGVGLIFARVNARYRDIERILPFAIQAGLLLSPVGYSSQTITSESLRLLYSLNPVVGLIDSIRWSILGGKNIPFYMPSFIIFVCWTVMVIAFGFYLFKKNEPYFADFI